MNDTRSGEQEKLKSLQAKFDNTEESLKGAKSELTKTKGCRVEEKYDRSKKGCQGGVHTIRRV